MRISAGKKINKLFFIVGRGRSGTSLLVTMLNQHPLIAIPPEAMFVMILYNKFAKYKRMSNKRICTFYEHLWIEKCMNRWKMDKEELKKDLLEMAENASFSDLCRLVYYHYGKAHNKTENVVIGDKNPHYSYFIKELNELFPEAKYIYVTRDYRDNILSFKNVSFDLNLTTLLAYRWKYYNETVLKLKSICPEKFLTLKYEQLLTDPKKQLEDICHFLEIDFCEDMLEYYKNKSDKAPEFVAEYHQNLKKPIIRKNFDLWKKRMKEEDIIKADLICQNTGKKLGYEPAHKKGKILFFLMTIAGKVCGWFSVFLEKLCFFLPLFILKRIMDTYRKIIHQCKDYYT